MQIQCLNKPQGNYVRHCWGTTPVFQTKEPTDWSAPDGPEGLAAAPTRVNTRQRESPQPNFARNLTRSLFEIAHKRCNSNNANSTFEQSTGELRATLLGNHPDQRGGRTHRQAAPVTSRCTRTEGVQCLQIGCNAYTSGARPPVTSSHADLPEWRSTDPTGLAAPGSGAAPTTNSARRRRSPNSWLGPRAAGPDGPSRRRAERAARDADNERATERAARVAPAA